MFRLFLILGLLGVWQQSAVAQATQPADDAAKLYLQAAKLLRANDDANIMSPSSSSESFPSFPAHHVEWDRMEKVDFAANAEARALAHQARPIEHVNWPLLHWRPPGVNYLNECRNLSNELADAALYEHFQGDDAAAIETLRDHWRLADVLETQSDKKLVCMLVGIGIRDQFSERLEIITSNVGLTEDPEDSKDLQVKIACELIEPLMKRPDAKTEVNEFVHAVETDGPLISKSSIAQFIETTNRANAECDMAAMSLACHLYRFDTKEWPKSLDDLRGYLPSLPVDPWGDGKQTLGYALIKSGLPDGSDRPLVYSRCEMKDGLFFRTDQPAYSFYTSDGSYTPNPKRKQGGQFRDVASWAPAEGSQLAATTRPLE